jgi:Na+/H+-dicarboxylate symporter
VIFVIWLIFAVLVGVYASSKGRSGVGFFFIAALLSPLIGFIIAAIVQPIRANTEAKALESGDVKKCPNCAELVKAEAKLCKHCHSELA